MLSCNLQSKLLVVQHFAPAGIVSHSSQRTCCLKRGVLGNSTALKLRLPAVRQQRKLERHLRASCFFNWEEEPLIKEAVKEPVAFFGGFFAGILRLNLEEEPLKEWIARTSEAAGITKDDDGTPSEEDGPVEISIE